MPSAHYLNRLLPTLHPDKQLDTVVINPNRFFDSALQSIFIGPMYGFSLPWPQNNTQDTNLSKVAQIASAFENTKSGFW